MLQHGFGMRTRRLLVARRCPTWDVQLGWTSRGIVSRSHVYGRLNRYYVFALRPGTMEPVSPLLFRGKVLRSRWLRRWYADRVSQSAEPAARYRQIAADLVEQITAEAYGDGASLPSESELAAHYDVSRGTIRQAFAQLRADGVVSSRRGARRTVLATPRLQSFVELTSFSRWARAAWEIS